LRLDVVGLRRLHLRTRGGQQLFGGDDAGSFFPTSEAVVSSWLDVFVVVIGTSYRGVRFHVIVDLAASRTDRRSDGAVG